MANQTSLVHLVTHYVDKVQGAFGTVNEYTQSAHRRLKLTSLIFFERSYTISPSVCRSLSRRMGQNEETKVEHRELQWTQSALVGVVNWRA